MEGFPGNALWIGDPVFIGAHVATGRLFLRFDRPLRGIQAPFDVLQFLIVFGLNTQMIESESVAAVGDGEIDARVVQHPFCVILMPHRGITAEQGAVKLNVPVEVLYRQVYMESFHVNPLKLIYA